MNQLTRPLFLVTARLRAWRSRQLINAVGFQQTLDRAVSEIELAGDPDSAAALLTQLQRTSHSRSIDARRRAVRTATHRRQSSQIIDRIAMTPPRQHLARNAELITQRRQRNALLVQCHQFRTKN